MNKKKGINVEKLTRRESALYTLGAYEMIMVDHKGNHEALAYYMSAVLEFMRAYLPDYSEDNMEQLFRICEKEKQTGTCRKLFDKRVQGVNE